jgi:hypothetical protein
MNLRLLAAGAVFSVALAACGSSGSSTLPAAHGRAATPVVPSAPITGGGTAASAQRSKMTISIAIPPKKKAPSSAGARTTKTVSPNAAYLDVVLQSLNGTAQPVTGPYNILVPLTGLQQCNTGGRDHARSTQSIFSCYSADVTAPVGDAVYAIGVLDQSMTLLDYAENVPVTISSGTTATLSTTLSGVGASVVGYWSLTNPTSTTQYNIQHGVDCSSYVVAIDPQAICSFLFDAADNTGDDMATEPGTGALANALSLSAVDLNGQQELNLGYDADPVDPQNLIEHVLFDPNAPDGFSGTSFNVGQLTTYNTVLHFDLSGIPSGTTHTIELTATLQPPVTTAFGPNVALPHPGAYSQTWDIPCRTVTIGPADPSGVPEGSVLHFCDPPSNLHLVVQ